MNTYYKQNMEKKKEKKWIQNLSLFLLSCYSPNSFSHLTIESKTKTLAMVHVLLSAAFLSKPLEYYYPIIIISK